MEIVAIIAVGVACFVIGFVTAIYLSVQSEEKLKSLKKEKKRPYPECSLKCDPNNCDTWCMAKELFTKDQSR